METWEWNSNNISIHNAILTWKTSDLCAGHSTPVARAICTKFNSHIFTYSPTDNTELSYHWLQPSVAGKLS